MRAAIGVRWKILALICAASCVSYILRTNLSIVGNTMIKELGLTELQFGLALSAFAWGYAIFQFPGGIFGDFVGSRKAITLIALIWGVLTLLTGMIPGSSVASSATILLFLVLLRFFVGVSHAPIFPVIGGTIANWFPVSGWGLPNGLTSTALTLGAAGAAPLLVALLQIGWRESFFYTAPIAFLVAFIWWWYARDFPSQHKAVSRQELALIEGARPPADHSKSGIEVWSRILKNREILLLTASYFCTNYVFYLFFNWFFYYLVDVRKIGQSEAGYLTAAQWIAGAAGATLGGFLCDYFVRKYGPRRGYRIVPVPSMLLSGVFLLIGAVAVNPYLAVAFLSLSFGCTQLTEGSFWSAIAAVSGRHAAAAGGVLNTGGNIVGGVGALLVPLTAQLFGWVTAVATGAIFAFAAALLWLWIRADIEIDF